MFHEKRGVKSNPHHPKRAAHLHFDFGMHLRMAGDTKPIHRIWLPIIAVVSVQKIACNLLPAVFALGRLDNRPALDGFPNKPARVRLVLGGI